MWQLQQVKQTPQKDKTKQFKKPNQNKKLQPSNTTQTNKQANK